MADIEQLIKYLQGAKNLFAEDKQFQKSLEGLPASERENISQLMQNESMFTNLLRLLPVEMQNQIAVILTPILETPDKAIELIQQCRYFEAREYLLLTISQYEATADKFMPASLASVSSFVVTRIKALIYDHLAAVESALGNIEESGRYHLLSNQFAVECGDYNTLAKSLLGLTVCYWAMGDYENALEQGNQAIEYLTGQNDRFQTHARILTTMSCIYDDLGRSDEAIQYATKAVALCRDVNDNFGLPYSLNNLAGISMKLDKHTDAIKVLEEARSIPEIRPDMSIMVLNNLAMCILQCSQSDEEANSAYELLLQGVKESRHLGNVMLEALCRGNQGHALQHLEQIDQASEAFADAARLFNIIGQRAQEAYYMSALADHLFRFGGNPDGAMEACRTAIEIIESIRGSMKKEFNRISYAASVTDAYVTAVMALLTSGKSEEALEYIERAKSRALLEHLTARIMKSEFLMADSEIFRKAIDLLLEMDEIRRSLESAAWQDFSETRANSPITQTTNEATSQNTEQQILLWEEKDYKLKGICAELSIHDKEKTDLIKVQPFSVKEFQETLDDETFVLEMFQTDEVLLLMCITKAGVVQYLPIDLSLRESIEIVTYVNDAIGQTSRLDVRSHDFIKDVRHPLRDIYQQILQPTEEWFRSFKRCIIIPHGLWHYFPFHTLYDQAEKVFLCDKIEIGYCPSAAVLQQCRKKNRVRRKNAILMSQNNDDLPLADEEVQRISRVFKDGSSIIFTGQNAYLGLVEKYPADIIHLACHGWFVSEEPLLSGIAIKPAEDQERNTYAIDLFNLHFTCSQITVSACATGLSLATNADELLGLSRGLFSGGAAALMLSLWKVADESTCQLMENYYINYVQNRQTKTRALQLSMQYLKAQPKYAHPFFWAPFVVMGEWG